MNEPESLPESTARTIDQKNNEILDAMGQMIGAAQEPPQVREPAPAEPAPPAQGDVPSYSSAPVTREGIRGMFSDPAVKPVDAEAARIPADTPIPEPENMNDRAKNAWAELRGRERQMRQANEALQKQVSDLMAAQEKFTSERDQLAAALKEKDDAVRMANEKIGKMDLSGSVEFRERFDQPLQQAEANMDAAVSEHIGGPAGEALSPEEVSKVRGHIMKLDDDGFRAYISRLGLDAQAALIEKRRTCLALSAERKRALDDWQTTSKGLSSIAASEHAADRALAMRNAAEEAIVFNSQTLPRDKRAIVLGDPFFSEDVAAANDEFRSFMQTAKDKDMARAVHAGFLLPVMNRALVTALETAREAQEQLARYRGIMHPGSYPSPRQEPPAARPEPVPTTPAEKQAALERKNAGIEDAIAGTLSSIGGAGYPRM